nr:hypothetical protein [Leifsonia sp. Leaf325]
MTAAVGGTADGVAGSEAATVGAETGGREAIGAPHPTSGRTHVSATTRATALLVAALTLVVRLVP